MADPTSLRRPPAGRRYDPTAIDATGTTLGDVLTSTDDGSGGKRAGWAPPAVTPDDLDPGVGAGTPGNLALTWLTIPPVVIRNVGAALTEPEAAVPTRRYLNTSAIGAWRWQLANWVGASGVELHLIYSLDQGTTFAEAGPLIDLTLQRFPLPGSSGALVEDALGDNVLFSWGLKGGDGTQVVKIGNLYSMATSSATPPDPPIIDTDLPQGGPLGNIVADFNALTLADLGTSDGASVSSWVNDVDAGNPAIVYTGATAPIFKTAGITGGLPSVRFNGTNHGLRFLNASLEGFTIYIVGENFVGTINSNYINNSTILINIEGSSQPGYGISIRADGKLNYGSGENFVVASTASRNSNNALAAGPHVLAYHRNAPGGSAYGCYVDAVNEGSGGPSAGSGLLDPVKQSFIGWKTVNALPGAFDLGRLVWYDQEHNATQIATVTAILAATWGTP